MIYFHFRELHISATASDLLFFHISSFLQQKKSHAKIPRSPHLGSASLQLTHLQTMQHHLVSPLIILKANLSVNNHLLKIIIAATMSDARHTVHAFWMPTAANVSNQLHSKRNSAPKPQLFKNCSPTAFIC